MHFTLICVGVVETVVDGVTQKDAPFCAACWRSLAAGAVPKFSIASGFAIADVPPELAELNAMEARMIGLGVCFTTCFRVRGGQDFTRGNSINYWNKAFDVVTKLPRPLSRCGVVRMKSSDEQPGQYYAVRPCLLRRALLWLREHNPL